MTARMPLIEALESRIASLERELAQARVNERRYLYLRDSQPSDFVVQQSYPKCWNSCHGPEMDSAIDCAIERASDSAMRGER